MTYSPELEAEYRYRYHERIGIMCGDQPPTPKQIATAKQEAAQACAKLSPREYSKSQKSEG